MKQVKSGFPCMKCKSKEVLFVNNERFVCNSCSFSWELTEMGKQLLRSLD